jgi:hypothetical protein
LAPLPAPPALGPADAPGLAADAFVCTTEGLVTPAEENAPAPVPPPPVVVVVVVVVFVFVVPVLVPPELVGCISFLAPPPIPPAGAVIGAAADAAVGAAAVVVASADSNLVTFPAFVTIRSRSHNDDVDGTTNPRTRFWKFTIQKLSLTS